MRNDTPNNPGWPDEVTWLTLLKPAIIDDTNSADTACRLWYVLIENIKAGPDGIERALSALSLALRLCFPYTAEFQAGFDHYMALLKGDLRPENEPLNVIAAALKQRNRPQERRHHGRVKRKA